MLAALMAAAIGNAILSIALFAMLRLQSDRAQGESRV
jgi:hypothetical protein